MSETSIGQLGQWDIFAKPHGEIAAQIAAATSSQAEEFSAEEGKSFRGWLPTITGRLSFSVFGDSNYPIRTETVNVADEGSRYLAIIQLRNKGDTVLPGFVQKLLYFTGWSKYDHFFRYVLIAKTTHQNPLKAQEHLRGKAYILDKDGWLLAHNSINDYQKLLKSFRIAYHNGTHQSLETSADHHHNLLISTLDKFSVFNVKVNISRTGTTDIKFDTTSVVYSKAPPLNDSRRVKKSCAQIFFFLKDIGHRHQHHDNRTDTIVDLYSVNQALASDLKWRSDTLYSIYRQIIKFKRNERSLTFNDCLGLIAYSETFRKISEEELTETLRESLPVYYSEQVIKSISATQSKIERRLEEDINDKDRTRNFLIAIFGIVLAYIGLMQFAPPHPPPAVNPILLTCLKVLLRSPGVCLILGLGAYFTIPSIFTKQKKAAYPHGVIQKIMTELRNNLLRLASAFSKSFTVFVLIAAGICFWIIAGSWVIAVLHLKF